MATGFTDTISAAQQLPPVEEKTRRTAPPPVVLPGPQVPGVGVWSRRRFRKAPEPLVAVDTYLHHVREEACARGYCFDAAKIGNELTGERLPITSGQLEHELGHLRKKLVDRSPKDYERISEVTDAEAHPLFSVFEGPVAEWERVMDSQARKED